MSGDEVRVREATDADIGRVVELWCEFQDYHGDLDPLFRRAEAGEESFREWVCRPLEEDHGLLLVAEAGGAIVAYLLGGEMSRPGIFAQRRAGMVYDLAVTASHRRRGIGSALVERALEWFSGRGLTLLQCGVVMANEPARAFWRRFGFHPLHEMLVRRG
jgi:ribosomal protein S18 acetylase RimI-like enzyme